MAESAAESGFSFWGSLVGLGLGSPFSRAAVFGLAGFLFQLVLKPRVSYLESGKAKAWSVTTGDLSEDSAIFTWWMWPTTAAFIGGFVF